MVVESPLGKKLGSAGVGTDSAVAVIDVHNGLFKRNKLVIVCGCGELTCAEVRAVEAEILALFGVGSKESLTCRIVNFDPRGADVCHVLLRTNVMLKMFGDGGLKTTDARSLLLIDVRLYGTSAKVCEFFAIGRHLELDTKTRQERVLFGNANVHIDLDTLSTGKDILDVHQNERFARRRTHNERGRYRDDAFGVLFYRASATV